MKPNPNRRSSLSPLATPGLFHEVSSAVSVGAIPRINCRNFHMGSPLETDRADRWLAYRRGINMPGVFGASPSLLMRGSEPGGPRYERALSSVVTTVVAASQTCGFRRHERHRRHAFAPGNFTINSKGDCGLNPRKAKLSRRVRRKRFIKRVRRSAFDGNPTRCKYLARPPHA